MNKNMKNKLIILNTTFNILLAITLVISGGVWAETNGVWHRAEDIVPGTFSSDEGNGAFTFPNDLTIQKDVFINGATTIDKKLTVKQNFSLQSEFECTTCISKQALKPSSVDSSKIVDLSVNTIDIANGAITTEKLNINNGLIVNSGTLKVNQKIEAGEFCLGGECHTSLSSVCQSWVAQNAIN